LDKDDVMSEFRKAARKNADLAFGAADAERPDKEQYLHINDIRL